MKKYNNGFIIGRFQHFHKGHERLVEEGLKLCNNLLILVGSSQEKETLRNPFTVETRIDIIKSIYDDKVIVKGVPDLTDENDISHEWGSYLLNYIKNKADFVPDLMLYGNDEARKDWFNPRDLENIHSKILDRNITELNISATKMRNFLVLDEQDKWLKYANEKIHDRYDFLRSQLLEIDHYKSILKS